MPAWGDNLNIRRYIENLSAYLSARAKMVPSARAVLRS
jgi:hypothetical protein